MLRIRVPWPLAALAILAAVAVFGVLGLSRLAAVGEPPVGGTAAPVTVHLFLPPDQVQHGSRFQFTFDPPDVLAPLRLEEGLDHVVAGATSNEEAWRRLAGWTARQWQEGVPNPYPPPDARIILRDIRSGFTGGFCAQYCFVLVQAIESFGVPARHVTIQGHEVVEAWLADEGRWVVFDPTYDLQVFDENGRSLNALEIHRRVEAGDWESLSLSEGHRAPDPDEAYLDRYAQFAVWIRNDFVSRPLNFQDFDRYRVWFAPRDRALLPDVSLSTSFVEDLY